MLRKRKSEKWRNIIFSSFLLVVIFCWSFLGRILVIFSPVGFFHFALRGRGGLQKEGPVGPDLEGLLTVELLDVLSVPASSTH